MCFQWYHMDVKLGLIKKQSTTKAILLKCGATAECRELDGLLIQQTLMYYRKLV